jgi:hypothetical protein
VDRYTAVTCHETWSLEDRDENAARVARLKGRTQECTRLVTIESVGAFKKG